MVMGPGRGARLGLALAGARRRRRASQLSLSMQSNSRPSGHQTGAGLVGEERSVVQVTNVVGSTGSCRPLPDREVGA